MVAKEILFASTNRGKLAEVQTLARRFAMQVIGLAEVSGVQSAPPEVVEDGIDYQANARKKAREYYDWSGLTTLADDTGLEVAALAGAPGVYSARYAGIGASARANRELLLANLTGLNDRSARFVCELVLISSGQSLYYARGELAGEIATVEKGKGGFGYDGIFFLPELGCTLAEAKERSLAVATHRERALESLFGQVAFVDL